MASITPRMSALLAEDYFDEHMDGEQADDECGGQDAFDGRTPLDRTIDRIGMGTYQWTLLALCGFGWLADNMWIQTIAIILPRVQQHYDVSDGRIGYLSSGLFAGMMIGAIGWGSCSDILGRSTAFNLTLCFTALFGLAASVMPSYPTLCISLFFLGTSVGGSMPTDGTLLLEHVPKHKQYLVTALSVFFSLGSVLSAIVGIIIIPGHSCPSNSPEGCDVSTMNKGWKYMLAAVGLITLSFFLARILFFKLHESPRYLVHAGRHEEARLNLQKISRFNGSELSLRLDDVIDHHHDVPNTEQVVLPKNVEQAKTDVREIFDANNYPSAESSETEPLTSDAVNTPNSSKADRGNGSTERQHYDSTGSSNVILDPDTITSPVEETVYPQNHSQIEDLDDASQADEADETKRRPLLGRPSLSRHSRRSSLYETKAKIYWALPRGIRRPLWTWLDKIAHVLSPEWRKTTILVWLAWCFMALAYTMFNVYLPKMLEMSTAVSDPQPKTLEATMWEVVIFTLAGCPGAIIGAYMVESSFGRRWSLAGSTFVTAAFCILFVYAESSFAILISTAGVSLSSTTMWAVLYGWTPEIFGTEVRGTACGTASALSRVGGMIAPILGGSLLVISRTVPVVTSAVVFVLAGLCVLLLRVKESGRTIDSSMIH